MRYNLVLWAWAAFLMYPCGSSSFKCVCNLVGMIFLGLIIFLSRGSIFLRQYEDPLLVVRERHVSLLRLG
jgi:LSD1 subclass zinc finger protein